MWVTLVPTSVFVYSVIDFSSLITNGAFIDLLIYTVQSTYIDISLYRHVFKFPNFSFNIFTTEFLLYRPITVELGYNEIDGTEQKSSL